MACTRPKPCSGGAPSPPKRSSFTPIEEAQRNFAIPLRGLSHERGDVQEMRMQVSASTKKPVANDLLSSLCSIRFDDGAEVLEGRVTLPPRVNTSQRLAKFPSGSCKCTYGYKCTMATVSKIRQLTLHALFSDLVSPERREEFSITAAELLSPAKLSQPKSAYFVGYSIHRVEENYSQTQIPGTSISEAMSLADENFQTQMLGTHTDSAAAGAAAPHRESEKGFSVPSATLVKDVPTNLVWEKTRALSEGTHTHSNASRESYRDRSSIDFLESTSHTSMKVKRTVSITDSDAVAPSPLPNDDVPPRPRGIQTCLQVPLFEIRSISSPARDARSDIFLAEALVVSPKLMLPSFEFGDLQGSKQLEADEQRAPLELATSLLTLNASGQLNLGDNTSSSPRATLPWPQLPTLCRQTNVEDVDMMKIYGKGKIQPIREFDVQKGTPTKKRFNQCADSPIQNPPMLQPRASNGYALKEVVDEMLHMARPRAVCHYRFGSPSPINYFMTPTPIKVPEVRCYNSTPREESCQLKPPGILRKAGAHCTDWRSLPVSPRQHGHLPNITQSDLLADFPQASEEEFFLQTPHALRDQPYTSRACKRLKTLDFDDIVHIADDDFMCLDLLEAFSE
jgi:hypothetical protein